MPLLVDGNNLMYALRKAGLSDLGRGGVVALLEHLCPTLKRVTVVFDGPPPRAEEPIFYPGRSPSEPQRSPQATEALYAGPRGADIVLLERIASDSAPRRLLVVSTDRQIRRAARRRRCQSIRSEDFVPVLLKAAQPAQRRRQAEPPGKLHGLTSQQAEAWLKELNLDVPGEDDELERL